MEAYGKIYPVILSGGSGSRLWPVSRAMHPKQFLSLHSDIPMLVETALRFTTDDFAPVSVVCNHQHRFMVAQCLADADIDVEDIILEPMGKNTAPAIALAALNVYRKDPNGLILILPSDHMISKTKEFVEAVKIARESALSGKLITFGIEPQYAETGYGYIQEGDLVEGSEHVRHVAAFYEKPDSSTAQKFIDTGGFYWNSGMFLFSVQGVIEEMNRLVPDMMKLVQNSLNDANVDLDFLRIAPEPFEEIIPDSIDYAVMEKTSKAAMMPVNIGWNDIGSWAALWDILEKDKAGNAVKGDVLLNDVKNSLIYSDKGILTAVMGLDDVVVVQNDDVVLVADKNRSQDVKQIVETLKQQNRPEVDFHSTIYRPWGSYKTIDHGPGYLVKTISVRPGCALSLQYHNHRAEHWVVVEGEAKVQRGDDVFILRKNESTYIPVKMIHRLENTTEQVLHMVEVQSGEYLAEDDIERLEDLYGRNR